MSPTREFQQRRRLSIDAEDELFKSLQEVQELNNSKRQLRAASPGNHSGRMKRRSFDIKAGSPATHSGRRERRSFGLIKSSSPGSYSGRHRQRDRAKNNWSISPKKTTSNRRNSRTATPPRGELGIAQSLGLQRQPAPGGAVQRPNRMKRRASTGTYDNDSPGFIVITKGHTARRFDQTKEAEAPAKGKTRTKQSPNPDTPPRSELGLSLSQGLQRLSPGGTVRRPNRMRRRASTGTHDNVSPGVIIISKGHTARRSDQTKEAETPPKEKGRTKRSPNPKLVATGGASSSSLVIRSFNRRRVLNTSPTGSPTNPKGIVYPVNKSPSQSPNRTKQWTEMTMRANLLKNAKPPRLDDSTASWASASWATFHDDIDSDVEKSDHTHSTKPTSERTGAHSDHSRTENADFKTLLAKLRDPAERERMKVERERLSQKPSAASSHSPQTSLKHDKVIEQNSSRNLKTFLQRSKRGYGQQGNLDGLSVMK